MKTNAVTKNFSYQKGTTTKKTNPRMHAQAKGHANVSSAETRSTSKVKRPQSTKEGLMGFSAGQKVPMKIFNQDYHKSNRHSMNEVVDANSVKKMTKRSLSGAQKKFFGL